MKIKNLLPIIGIIILFIILLNLEFDKIFHIFSEINPLYSIICFFAIIPLVLLSNFGWQLLLKKQKIRVSYIYSLKNFFIGYFYGFITPGGFGAYTKALYLTEESKAPLPKCVSNIIIYNTLDYTSLLLLGLIGAVFLSSVSPYLSITIIFVIILILILFLFFFKKDKSKPIFQRIIKTRIFKTIHHRLENSIDSFYEDLPKFKDLTIPFTISFIGWVIKFSELYFISKLFSIDVPFFYFILIMAVADVVASLPISYYGLGTREAFLLPILTFYSTEASIISEQIVSFSLFTYVIIWLTPSVFGAIVTFFESKKDDDFVIDEKKAKSFEKYMQKYPELYEYLAKVIKKNIPKSVEEPIIVDLGTGPGILLSKLREIIPESNIIGIDPSKHMIGIINKKSGIKTMIGNSENIKLDDNYVDIVVVRFNLTYWKKPHDSFKEINRILKPGGKIILEFLNKDFSKLKLFGIKSHMILNKSGLDIAKYHIDAYKTAYSLESVERLLKSNGFKITYREGEKKDWKFIVVGKKIKQKAF